MKGGKQGLPRRAGGATSKGKASPRGPAKKAGGKGQRSGAPKKGERTRTYGGRSSSDEP